jgi:hypothetical protein
MRLRLAALTLVFGLTVAGVVGAEESGNWFTRMFTPTPEKTDKDEAKKSDTKSDASKMPPTITFNQRAKRARADLDRRWEVCEKLRAIAVAKGDEEMERKVEQLHQRAWDVYVAATNAGPVAETKLKKGDR